MSEVVWESTGKAEWVELIARYHFNQSTCFTVKKKEELFY